MNSDGVVVQAKPSGSGQRKLNDCTAAGWDEAAWRAQDPYRTRRLNAGKADRHQALISNRECGRGLLALNELTKLKRKVALRKLPPP
jgi:hypothetical protein